MKVYRGGGGGQFFPPNLVDVNCERSFTKTVEQFIRENGNKLLEL